MPHRLLGLRAAGRRILVGTLNNKKSWYVAAVFNATQLRVGVYLYMYRHIHIYIYTSLTEVVLSTSFIHEHDPHAGGQSSSTLIEARESRRQKRRGWGSPQSGVADSRQKANNTLHDTEDTIAPSVKRTIIERKIHESITPTSRQRLRKTRVSAS